MKKLQVLKSLDGYRGFYYTDEKTGTLYKDDGRNSATLPKWYSQEYSRGFALLHGSSVIEHLYYKVEHKCKLTDNELDALKELLHWNEATERFDMVRYSSFDFTKILLPVTEVVGYTYKRAIKECDYGN